MSADSVGRTGGVGRALTAASVLLGLSAVLLSVPPLRFLIEQSMVWHMVVQMPLLVAAGWLFGAGQVAGRHRPAALLGWDQFGLTSFLLAQALLTYWMLPSAIDRAVVLPMADAVKLLSLLASGVLLSRAMRLSPGALQLFFVGYAVSMLSAVGLVMATDNRRICNAYALESQWAAGWSLVGLAVGLGAVWGVVVVLQAARRQNEASGATAWRVP